jgi:hypothetical protein
MKEDFGYASTFGGCADLMPVKIRAKRDDEP